MVDSRRKDIRYMDETSRIVNHSPTTQVIQENLQSKRQDPFIAVFFCACQLFFMYSLNAKLSSVLTSPLSTKLLNLCRNRRYEKLLVQYHNICKEARKEYNKFPLWHFTTKMIQKIYCKSEHTRGIQTRGIQIHKGVKQTTAMNPRVGEKGEDRSGIRKSQLSYALIGRTIFKNNETNECPEPSCLSR